MDEYLFEDALTGSTVGFDRVTGEARLAAAGKGMLEPCPSVFFPGCSLINYALPLVAAVYDTLRDAGSVSGISLLCCGKILSYEPDGEAVRAAFEETLREHVAAAGVERIVAACPNCAKALRDALAADAATAGVEVTALPTALAHLGYAVDAGTAARLVAGDAGAFVRLCAHDSCPDRDRGEFADGMRALLPAGMCVEPAHARARSLCCGSLLRAAGKFEAADKMAARNGEEAREVHADALVTACLSCAFQLNAAQAELPAVHFLELLYDWRIDWASAGAWMKLRFLFDETLGVAGAGERAFVGLGADEAPAAAESTVADRAAEEASEDARALTGPEEEARHDVTMSNEDVEVLGE